MQLWNYLKYWIALLKHLDTKDKGLKMIPDRQMIIKNMLWKLIMYTDSDYSSDPATHKSVSGFCLYVLGVLVSWKFKAQASVTLSSTEAEYVAL